MRSALPAFALIALCLASPAVAQTTPDADARAVAVFDAMAARYPALNVTVRKQGRIVFEREGGVLRGRPGRGRGGLQLLFHRQDADRAGLRPA